MIDNNNIKKIINDNRRRGRKSRSERGIINNADYDNNSNNRSSWYKSDYIYTYGVVDKTRIICMYPFCAYNIIMCFVFLLFIESPFSSWCDRSDNLDTLGTHTI